MKVLDFERIVEALAREDVKYLVVGGLAVVAHGYGRMTNDIDLVIQLTPKNVINAFRALQRLGYQPRIPVTAQEFSDPVIRRTWIESRHMKVLNLWSDQAPLTPVDLFAEEPFDFSEAFNKAVEETLASGHRFRFVDIETLIEMKRKSGRPIDLEDIRNLELLRDG